MDKSQIERILSKMKENGISKHGLARMSGISHPTIIRLLRDEDYNPTLNTIKAVAKAIGVETEWIMEGKDFKKGDFLGVNGFIDYRGEVKRIKSFNDLKKLVSEIDSDLEAPKKAQAIVDEDIANQETQSKDAVDISSIDLFREESYDTSKVNTWSFRKSDDEKDEIPNDLGNMCKGYPFKVCGEEFLNSECAYISGLFSQSDKKNIEIQRELQKSDNGYEAKKAIRRKYEQVGYGRKDWNTFNVQWMLYVVWQKVKQNKDFQKLLRHIPNNAVIVENSTYQKGETSKFWGMKNETLKAKLEIMERAVDVQNYKEKKSELKHTKMLTRNSINHVGTWEGVNCMGKILTICKHCLESGIEPYIDYDLLRNKNIYLMGKLLTFNNAPNVSKELLREYFNSRKPKGEVKTSQEAILKPLKPSKAKVKVTVAEEKKTSQEVRNLAKKEKK